MQEAKVICERLTHEFTEEYMEKLFYFCLKKTGNHTEAEDLTQDIALQIITALKQKQRKGSFTITAIFCYFYKPDTFANAHSER